MTTIKASPEVAAPIEPASVVLEDRVVRVHWRYNTTWEYWSFVTTPHLFAEWVQGGFVLVCNACVARGVRIELCDHVEFPIWGRVRAITIAKAITMGLVD